MGEHSGPRGRRESTGGLPAAERWLLGAAGVLVVALLLIELIGGRTWAWTGFQDNQSLWDWLHLLLLPVVLTLLPVLARRRPRAQGRTLGWLAGLGALLVVTVVAGYLVPWAWTGFSGNTLWDWLELLLLPISVALLPALLESGRTGRARILGAFGGFLLGFGLLALPGYVVPWRWTGVTGNTLWDWLELLIVPFALPVAVTLVLHHSRERA